MYILYLKKYNKDVKIHYHTVLGARDWRYMMMTGQVEGLSETALAGGLQLFLTGRKREIELIFTFHLCLLFENVYFTSPFSITV